MSAFVPSREDAEATDRAFANVLADKQREAGLGYDGTWVAHPDLEPVAREAFDAGLGEDPDQRHVVVEPVDWAELTDLTVPGCTCTRAGLVADLRVALLDSLLEDAATAEIARCQVRQWIHLGVALDEGTTVTRALVESELVRLVGELEGVEVAADVVRRTVLTDELPDFLTLAALPLLG
jgi:malate synthase